MLNVNSPTVQAMLKNLPQGTGNLPMYFGNTPYVAQQTEQPAQSVTPYPSPKEMLMQSGNQNIYHQNAYMPTNNYVGGYNPGFNAAFNSYVNPYMGGYVNPYYVPMDMETRFVYDMANMNGISYREQLDMESNIYKLMSRTASINMHRSEEEIKKREALFDPYDRREAQRLNIDINEIKMKHVVIKFSDGHTADINPDRVFAYGKPNFVTSSSVIETLKQRGKMFADHLTNLFNNMHSHALERTMDDVDLIDFFNKNIGSLISRNRDAMLNMQIRTNSSLMYSKNEFKDSLLRNNGCKVKSQQSAIEKFTARYGYMPDGRPVSPGHDPSIGQSFSMDNNGQITITPPNFIANRMEMARARFIQSIG